MWAWFIGGYAVFLAVLIGYATHVALSGVDTQHRADAYKVLKLIWGTTTSASGLVAIFLKLHEAGVI